MVYPALAGAVLPQWGWDSGYRISHCMHAFFGPDYLPAPHPAQHARSKPRGLPGQTSYLTMTVCPEQSQPGHSVPVIPEPPLPPRRSARTIGESTGNSDVAVRIPRPLQYGMLPLGPGYEGHGRRRPPSPRAQGAPKEDTCKLSREFRDTVRMPRPRRPGPALQPRSATLPTAQERRGRPRYGGSGNPLPPPYPGCGRLPAARNARDRTFPGTTAPPWS